jgi:ketosteroid isomerase-like protein
MFKMLCFACALATSTVVVAGQAMPAASTQKQVNAAEAAIRSARVELNAALANRDLKTTVRYWLPDVNTIGGDGSLWAGRDENTKGFAKIFKDPDFVFGLRTPAKVEVATGGVAEAAESGVWEWRERVGGQLLTYSGPYLVMWQLVDGNWRIRSELYVTTGCTGGPGCR